MLAFKDLFLWNILLSLRNLIDYLANMTEELKKISTEKFDVTLLEDGIVENYIRSGMLIEAEDLVLLKKISSEIAGNKPYVLLIVTGELATYTKEARELSASKAFIDKAVAKAVLIESIAQKIIGNFYLKVSKPYLQTRLFSDREKAIDWLKSIMEYKKNH